MTRGLRFAVIVGLVFGALSACVPIARGPYTAADLARDGQREPAAALLRYLAQPQADPAVCAMPFLKNIELDGVDDLVSAGVDNDLRPDVFYDCVLHAFDQNRSRRQRSTRSTTPRCSSRRRDSPSRCVRVFERGRQRLLYDPTGTPLTVSESSTRFRARPFAAISG